MLADWFYFESNTYLHFKDDYGMRKNDGQFFDLAFDRISKRMKETEKLKSEFWNNVAIVEMWFPFWSCFALAKRAMTLLGISAKHLVMIK